MALDNTVDQINHMDPEIREALLALVRGCSDLREATARVTELALNALMLLAQMIQKTQMFAGMNRKLVLICQTPASGLYAGEL